MRNIYESYSWWTNLILNLDLEPEFTWSDVIEGYNNKYKAWWTSKGMTRGMSPMISKILSKMTDDGLLTQSIHSVKLIDGSRTEIRYTIKIQ